MNLLDRIVLIVVVAPIGALGVVYMFRTWVLPALVIDDVKVEFEPEDVGA